MATTPGYKPPVGAYDSPDLPSFEAVQVGGPLPESQGNRELVARVAGDLVLYVHETTLRDAAAAYSQGAITIQNYNKYTLDARNRIVHRREELGLGPRPVDY